MKMYSMVDHIIHAHIKIRVGESKYFGGQIQCKKKTETQFRNKHQQPSTLDKTMIQAIIKRK